MCLDLCLSTADIFNVKKVLADIIEHGENADESLGKNTVFSFI